MPLRRLGGMFCADLLEWKRIFWEAQNARL